MKKDYRKLGDNDIVKLVEDNIKTSVGYYDSDLSRERKKVLEYYQGKLPRPAHDGNSKQLLEYASMQIRRPPRGHQAVRQRQRGNLC